MQMLVINRVGFWEAGHAPPPNVSGSIPRLYSWVEREVFMLRLNGVSPMPRAENKTSTMPEPGPLANCAPHKRFPTKHNFSSNKTD